MTVVTLDELAFEALLDAMPDALLVVGDDGRIKAVNSKLANLTGYGEEELLGQTIELLVPQRLVQQHTRIREKYGQAPSSRSMGELDNILLRTKLDIEIPVDISLSPLAVEEGQFIIATIRDISKRSVVEQELRASKSSLDKAQRLARMGSWNQDLLSNSLTWSSEIYRMFGLENQEIPSTYDAFLEYVHPDDRRSVHLSFLRSLRNRKATSVEHRLLLKDGTIKSVVQRFESVFDDNGAATAYVGSIQDVTAQKEREEELQRFRVAMESSPDSITFTDVDTMRFLYVNKVGAQRVGYSKEELLQMGPADVLSCDRKDLARMYEETIAAGDEGTRTEIEVITKTGKRTHSEARRRALLLDNRWVIITISIDLTERKDYEAKLQQAHDELELRVEERTRQLRIEIEQRKKASQVKNEFLASMSHELRTPLNSILGFAQLLSLSEDGFSANQREHLQHILSSGEHMLRLVSDLLQLNTIEEGRLSLQLENVSAAETVRDCLNQVRQKAEEKNIQLIDQCSRQESLPSLWADPMRLNQLLLTLLSNAIKYNREGGSITVFCNKAAGNMLRINVVDTGSGLSTDGDKDLFAPFERLGREAGPIEGGGIGLSIAKRIVELLDGNIGYESEAGRGSTFWVDIPLSKDQGLSETSFEPAQKSEELKPAAAPEPGKVVLYIEDDPDNMDLMRHILARAPRLDVKMLEAGNAELGIELARKHRPDLILMDLNLPGINGDEAVKKLKCIEETETIPVIAISANAMPHTIETVKADGFEACITKPVNVKAIQQTINELLNS